MLPAGIGASFEMIEPEFGFEFLILLFDRPALMREGHQRAQRRLRRQMHEVVLDALGASGFFLAQQPDFGREVALAPRMGRVSREPPQTGRGDGAACRCATKSIATRGRQAPGHGADGHGARSVDQARTRAGTPRARQRLRPELARASQEDDQIRRDPQRIRQPESMQGGAQRGDIAKFRIAEDRRDREARRAHLPQQRERLAPLFLKDDAGRNAGARPLRPASATPWADTAAPRETSRGRRSTTRRSSRLGNSRFCRARHRYRRDRADRVWPLFRKAGAVEDQDAAAFRNHRAQPTPHLPGVPGRMRNEVLERLIGDRLGDPRQHRLHRLPLAVAEHPLDVRAQGHQLRAMPEAALELLEPAHEALDARGRRVVDHRAAPYQTMTKSTMSSIQITRETRTNQRSDKVELSFAEPVSSTTYPYLSRTASGTHGFPCFQSYSLS